LKKNRGIKPSAVVMDAGYSSLKNSKVIRDHGWVLLITSRKNRKLNRDLNLETLDVPDEELSVHLRGYGSIIFFKFLTKNRRVDYVSTNRTNPTPHGVKKIIKSRWSIEVYHRELKQTGGIERCQAPTG
jgi:hypothetical protein